MSLRTVSLAAVLAAALPALAAPARAQDRADSAWNRGATAVAESLYARRVAADSSDLRALHRLALIYAWSRRFPPSLALFDRLLAAAPQDVEARRDRARVLSWAGDFRGSAAAYQAVLAASPGDRGALLGLAQVLSWSGRLDTAAVVYRTLLARDSTDSEARDGLARVTSWKGDLRGAEAAWRTAVAADSADMTARAGLARTLRWQGRYSAAAAELDRVPAPARDSGEVGQERREIRAAVGPRASYWATNERDSDHNRITTLAAAAGWRPALPVDLVASGYYRWTSLAGLGIPGQDAYGGKLDASGFLEPGWVVSAGLGQSWSNAPGAVARTSASAGIATPARYPLGATLGFSSAPLDATVQLIQHGVVVSQWALTARFEPVSPWSASATLSRATFFGTGANRRLQGLGLVTRSLPARWAVGVTLRAFGFQKTLTDGYFDPDFYGLAEAFVRWRPVVSGWELNFEAAPGAQKVRAIGRFQATARAGAGVSRSLGPGRQISLGALFMTAGLQSFAVGASNYKYFALTLSGTWALPGASAR